MPSLDHGQCMTKPFVLEDGSMAYTLVLAEDAVGKRHAFPADLQWLIEESIELDVLACKLFRDSGALQDALFAFVMDGVLRADVALLTVTQMSSGEKTQP